MAHLNVYLYDKVGDRKSICSFSDGSYNTRTLFHNLNKYNAADKAAKIMISKSYEYRIGDHVLLLDQSRGRVSDIVAIDPDIKYKVDLNKVIFNNRGFADRAAAAKFITHPNIDGGYRLRVRLFDRESPGYKQNYPTLIFYDWQVDLDNPKIDLNKFNFADKTAYIIVEKGPKYQKGDRIILHDHSAKSSIKLILEPDETKKRTAFNLNSLDYTFADKAAILEFSLVPDAHLSVNLYNRPSDNDKKPMHILNDYNPQNPKRPKIVHNLNEINAADKVAKIIVEQGIKFRRGDHIRLLNEVRKHSTDTVSVDPDVKDKVDLNYVIINNRGFADRAAGVQIVQNTNTDGSFRLRARLYDREPGNSSFQQKHPTLILYDWEFPPSSPDADLNAFHLADKISTIILDAGPKYVEGDKIILYDHRGKNSGQKPLSITTGLRSKTHNLNRYGWADKTAVIKFVPKSPIMGKTPEKVELYEGSVKKLTLTASNPGSLNDLDGDEPGLTYNGHATSAKIYGPAGSAVTFFDDQGYRLSENAVRIKKLVKTPVTVNLARNFVNSDDEIGDGIYQGTSPNEEFEWTLFKNVKRNWFQRTFPDFDSFLQDAKQVAKESKWGGAHWVVDGIGLFQATGIGNTSSNNYRVDNCSSVYFDFEKIEQPSHEIPTQRPYRPISLRAYNGQYVCAEGGGGGEVVANRHEIGVWETFELIDLENNKVALRAHNGQYVCAEGGGGGEVVANRNRIGVWETFNYIRI